ncbi:MAG: DNA polymerase IV [Peptoniphilus sp.]|nr:DNA polymerase IV [Peptoniphilus sp.]MDD7363519.1 DNA polymerase IV [Bacillota bacterium]MDY6044778.1 DNA polymerase IV [Peptoniphilus sp.]
MDRILHVDMDAFFASVETVIDPSLRGKPLAVGGNDSSGIVTTASYEARKYGIHSAMPMFMAKSLCPHLIVVPTRKGVYGKKSREVFGYLKGYGYPVEMVSIDEAYIDLTRSGDAVAVAKSMQKGVYERTSLTMSCGLSYNKFLAKIASDYDKPRGFTVIGPREAQDLLKTLAIRDIHGIGKKTEEKLLQLGVRTGNDLLQLERSFLEEEFGKLGIELYERIRGIDRRPVKTERKRKSIGSEETFHETRERAFFERQLRNFAEETVFHMERRAVAAYTVTVKMKTCDFHIHTKSRTFSDPIEDVESLYDIGVTLFSELYRGEKLRLLGLSVSGLVEAGAKQLCFL